LGWSNRVLVVLPSWILDFGYWMATFYYDVGSSNSWRVAIQLHEKGLKPTHTAINLFKGEQKSPEFLKVNPRGQVPAWVDGDIVVVESLAIMMYLEHRHPKHPLIPSSPKDYATFLTRLFQYPAKLDTTNILAVVAFSKKTREDLRDKIVEILKELREWDKVLEGRDYFAHSFSLADIAVIPLITTNVEILGLDLSQFPNLHAWYRRMWQRPSVKETCTFVDVFKGIVKERVLEGAKI